MQQMGLPSHPLHIILGAIGQFGFLVSFLPLPRRVTIRVRLFSRACASIRDTFHDLFMVYNAGKLGEIP